MSFARSSAELRPASFATLDRITEFAHDCPSTTIAITGHTDASGDEDWNRQLSLARAQAVADRVAARGLAAGRLVVTGVGSLIHLYSIGYMHGEEGFYRYFSYLNLFVFSMLMLVLGNNALVMFIGWEGVGLCSYLLIGFWFNEEANAVAGKKAFVVNRIGDFGFLLGLFLLFWGLGQKGVWTIDFGVIQEHVNLLSPVIITAICLLLFMGAMGKSSSRRPTAAAAKMTMSWMSKVLKLNSRWRFRGLKVLSSAIIGMMSAA